MAQININFVNAKRAAHNEQTLAGTLKSLSQEVSGVRNNLRYKIAGREQISERLRQVAQQISEESTSVSAMSNGFQQLITRYEQAENVNRDNLKAEKTTAPKINEIIPVFSESILNIIKVTGWPKPNVFDWLQSVLPIFSIAPVSSVSLIKFLTGDESPFDSTLISYESDDGLSSVKQELIGDTKVNIIKAEKENGGWAKKVDDWEKAHQKKTGDQLFYDPTTKKFVSVDQNDKEAVKAFSEHNKGTIPVDVRLAGVGTSGSTKWLGGDGKYTGNVGGLSGEWGVGNAEGHVDAYAGLLGVGASVGGSVSAFTADGKVYLGNEDAQVYLKGDVTAGKVGGELGGSIGLVDKSGNFNPSAYLGASAEALAAEVSGSVGGKIAGTEVAVKGSVNFGIGAHANVGIHDGKLSLDIGASLGVGVGIKLDIDVSGTVKAIGKAAGNVSSFIKKLF